MVKSQIYSIKQQQKQYDSFLAALLQLCLVWLNSINKVHGTLGVGRDKEFVAEGHTRFYST